VAHCQPTRKERLPLFADREDPSPLGEFVAEATEQGYRVGGGKQPFQGYYFKILTKQGPAARGGEYGCIVDGKMIGGFALVAVPPNTGIQA
jgi:hypothetical protein